MKSEIVMKKDSALEDCKYPWLGIGEKGDPLWEKIVMFTSKDTGVVVSAKGSQTQLGEYCDYWNEDSFEEFKGQVILSND